MDAAAPDPPPPDPAPSPDDAPPAAAPVPARREVTWEDRVALAAAFALLVAAFLPWWNGQPWFDPFRDALATAFLGLLSLAVHVLRPDAVHERVRRRTDLVLGLLALLVAAWVSVSFYQFHAAQDPKAGVVGHLLYFGVGLDLTLLAAFLLAWSGIPTRRPAPAPVPGREPVDRLVGTAARIGLPLLVFLAAFATYQHQVEEPSIIDFDEAHYVRVALNMTDGVIIDPAWGEPRPFNFEHPPVGKYLIAFGYWWHGEPHDELAWNQYKDLCDTDHPECEEDARSWRLGSTLVGALGVVGIYWIGQRLFHSVAAGLFAAAFLLGDNLYYLHSRLAMLDIFHIALALLALGVMLGPTRWHPWAGGAIYGLALASKHPALFLLPVVLILLYLRAPETGRARRLRHALLAGVFLPLLVYFLTYTPYLVTWAQMGGPLYALEMFQFIHTESVKWTYGADVEPHPYISDPWTWMILRRPVFYFVGYDAANNVGHIYAIGNPVLWWLGAAAVVYMLYMAAHTWIAGRPRLGPRAAWDWLARPFPWTPQRGHLVAALLFLTAYGPYFLLQRDPFNFYFLTAVPFLALALAAFAGYLWDHGPSTRALAVGLLVLILAVFAFYHPVVAGTYIPESDFQYIMNRIPGMRQ